jgi:MFS family permease
VLQVPSGVIADRWSRRQILAWAQLARGVGFVVWLIYPHFWGFFVGLQLWGIKSAFTSGTYEALLYDELKARGLAPDYTRIFGRTRAVQSGGVLLAALGAAVVVRFGYAATLIASVVSVTLAFATALSLPAAPPAAWALSRRFASPRCSPCWRSRPSCWRSGRRWRSSGRSSGPRWD